MPIPLRNFGKTADDERVLCSSLRFDLFGQLYNEGGIMEWYTYVAYLFWGAFLVNAVPHFVSGVCGHKFPTPFASPPGKGESSPTVNVLWGTFNLAIGYVLMCRVGEFHLKQTSSVVALGAGGLLMAVMLSRTFGNIYSAQ